VPRGMLPRPRCPRVLWLACTAASTHPPINQPTKKKKNAHSYTTLLTLPTSASVRRMGPTTWVTATMPAGSPFEAARSAGFSRCFAYIDAHGYEMTAPVLTRVGDDGEVRVSFLLPASVAGAPADGAAQGVVVESLPAQTVVVRPFKGVAAWPTTWGGLADAARGLAAEAGTAQLQLASPPPAEPEEPDDGGDGTAEKAAAAVGKGTSYAGYSSPMTPPEQKYSEVWLAMAPDAAIPGAAP